MNLAALPAPTLVTDNRGLARLMEPEDVRGHGDLHMRLHDKERARDRGMSW